MIKTYTTDSCFQNMIKFMQNMLNDIYQFSEINITN